MSTKAPVKFTATLVEEADKALVVKMREESGLSEKALMTLIISNAEKNRAAIIATGKKQVEAERAVREASRKSSAEALKAKMAQARAEVRAEKEAAKAKVATKPVEAPATKTEAPAPKKEKVTA
jgi:uncharacterized protein YceH (UPF0502 family)